MIIEVLIFISYFEYIKITFVVILEKNIMIFENF